MSRLYILLLIIHLSSGLKLNLALYEDDLSYMDEERSLDDFMLLSSNHPTKLILRDCPKWDPDVRMQAIIEHPGSTCSFPVFGWEEARRHVKLWSLGQQLQILQVIKIFDDPTKNSMDLFVVNMASCEFTKTEILQGYDYFAAGGAFIVFEPKNTASFEIFTLDGESECGTRICKREFDVKNRRISKPMKFPLLEDEFQSWQLTFMASASKKGYFAIVRSKEAQIKLLSLNFDGEIINTSDDSAESKVHFLKMSTYNGAFSFCYTLDNQQQDLHCMQLDDNLKLLANVTHDVGYKPSFLAVHNPSASDALLVLTVRCDDLDCLEHEMHVTKLYKDSSKLFAKFKDEDGCAPRNQQQFNFYEDRHDVCFFYACDLPVEFGKTQMTVRYRCLGFNERQ